MVLAFLVPLALFSLLLFLALLLAPAVVAASRGYSFLFWLVVSVGMNPVVALFVLAALPDRSLDGRRAREVAILDHQIASARAGAPGRSAAPVRSIGDASTLG